MNNGAFGEGFPYVNFHDLNMDWIIKIAKDFLDQYTHIQDIIAQGIIDIGEKTDTGIELLQEKYETLDNLLQEWYNEHSEDIANALADALEDLNEWYTEHSGDISDQLTQAITDFSNAADLKAAQAIATIPGDYSEVTQEVLRAVKGNGTLITTEALLNTLTTNTKSCNNFPLNSVVSIGADSIGLTDYPAIIPSEQGKGTYITFSHNLNGTACIGQIYINKHGQMAYRYFWNSSFTKWNIPVQGQNHLISTTANLEEITGSTKSCDDFPTNSIQTLGDYASVIGLLNYPTIFNTHGVGTYFTFKYTTDASSDIGKVQLYVDPFGRMALRTYYTSSYGWQKWNQIGEDVAFVNCDFPNGEMGYNSKYDMIAGTTYYCRTNIPSTINSPKRFNVFTSGDNTDYKSMFNTWVEFTPGTDGYMRIANLNGYTGKMIVEVRKKTPENEAIVKTPTIYKVDCNGVESSQTNLVDLLLGFVHGVYSDAYADSNPEYMYMDETPKIIYLYPGTYNIFNEYISETQQASPRLYPMSDIPEDNPATACFGRFNAFLPPNTKLIGIGDVTLKFTPTTSEITQDASHTWSPLNIYANCEVENITIIAKNCRYGIHDDPGYGRYPKQTHIFKNVRVNYEEGGEGFGYRNTIGFGFCQEGYYIFEDCEFYYDGQNANGIFYGHDSGTGNAHILVKNCIINSTNDSENKGVKVQTNVPSASNPTHNTLKIENCYIHAGLRYDLVQTTSQQCFEVILLNSGTPTVTTYKPSGNVTENPYPPKMYNA